MRFHFHLRQLVDIAPWHNADGSNPHLGWFGLTDGWYWIEAGSAELFRYNRPLVAKWRREYSDVPWLEALPYVDYQVSRLWEDVLEILPAVLDPVPSRLAHALGPDEPWINWERAAKTAVEQAPHEQEAWDLLESAAGWWWARQLNTSYLQAAPQICFWSDGADIHIQWDNRACVLDGLPAWEAVIGEHKAPVADFIAEAQAFDARFLSRMHDRIAIAQSEWTRPDVALEPGLNQEQVARTGWPARRFDAIKGQDLTHWDAVFQAIARIEALPGFATDHALRLSHS